MIMSNLKLLNYTTVCLHCFLCVRMVSFGSLSALFPLCPGWYFGGLSALFPGVSRLFLRCVLLFFGFCLCHFSFGFVSCFHHPLEITVFAGEAYSLSVVPSGKPVISWAGPYMGFPFLFVSLLLPAQKQLVWTTFLHVNVLWPLMHPRSVGISPLGSPRWAFTLFIPGDNSILFTAVFPWV